jgi:glycosyltransferase involved in cell wall biosynthesis
MVIVHLTSSRFVGSVERQMLGLASGLPSAYGSVFISFSEGGLCQEFLAEARREGFTAVALQNDTPRLRAACGELCALLRQFQADVVCCHGYKSNLLGLIAATRLRIPAIAVCHGWTGENLRVKAYEFVDRRVLPKMAAVVCVSHAQAAKIRRAGVPSARVFVIHDAVRPERFSNPDLAYRHTARAFLPRRLDRLVLAAGRLSPEKGFGDLVEAAAVVARTDPSVGFVLFGSGRLRNTLTRQIADRGLEHTFHLAGFRNDLDKFLPHFDLTVLPSYTEGLPNIVLESFAAGVPVVATAVGGTPELVEHGGNGYLVPPRQPNHLADGILKVLRSGKESRQMGLQGQVRVLAKFSFEAQSRAYQSLFHHLRARSLKAQSSSGRRRRTQSLVNGRAPSGKVKSAARMSGPPPESLNGNMAIGSVRAKMTSRPIKVCFLIDRLGTGGTETQLVSLIRHLDRTLVTPRLCLLDGSDAASKALEPNDSPGLRLGVRSLRHPSTAVKAARFARFLQRERIDVLQVYFADSTYFGALVGRLAGVPCIVRSRFDLGYWMTPIHRALGRLFNHLLDATVVNCKACCRSVTAEQRTFPHPVATIENGVDLSAFTRIPIAAPANQPRVVGMVANLRAVKDPQLFIRAAHLVSASQPDTRFAIAGEGELRGELEQLIEQLGLSERFLLLGRVADIPAFLSTLDVAVLCSSSEGMSNAVLEYMAAGRAITVTDVGGNSQLIENGVHGFLTPAGDARALAAAIGHLLTDPDLAVRMATAARERACEHYGLEQRVRRFECFYEALVSNRRGAFSRTVTKDPGYAHVD